jgi:hypothetical protein
MKSGNEAGNEMWQINKMIIIISDDVRVEYIL